MLTKTGHIMPPTKHHPRPRQPDAATRTLNVKGVHVKAPTSTVPNLTCVSEPACQMLPHVNVAVPPALVATSQITGSPIASAPTSTSSPTMQWRRFGPGCCRNRCSATGNIHGTLEGTTRHPISMLRRGAPTGLLTLLTLCGLVFLELVDIYSLS